MILEAKETATPKLVGSNYVYVQAQDRSTMVSRVAASVAQRAFCLFGISNIYTRTIPRQKKKMQSVSVCEVIMLSCSGYKQKLATSKRLYATVCKSTSQ